MEMKDINKKKTLKRKLEQKIKYLNKKARFDLNALKREVYSYQFRSFKKPSWSKSFHVEKEHNNYVFKNKDQQHGSPGVGI